MATSSSQTHNSFSLLLSTYVTLFLLFLNNAESAYFTSFFFSKSKPNQEKIILQGNAIVTPNGTLELTKLNNGNPVSRSLGRALYSVPIRIYDITTGSVASFTTSFSFIIKAPTTLDFADGLAFFLAPIDTQPQKRGGYLGLFPNKKYNTSNQIVAFEIDTFVNDDWDPKGRHIGINVNSIRSDNTSFIELVNGHEAIMEITYQASSKILTASLVYPSLWI